MDFVLALGWTGSFDHDASVLHLATGDRATVASVTFGPAPERRGGNFLDRATGLLEADTHRRDRERWHDSLGRLAVGQRAVLRAGATGIGELVNGTAVGLLRRRRTGTITLDGRTYTVRHRSRWRTVVDLEGQRVGVLTRRPLSRRRLPLSRTPLPTVRTTAVTEADQLAVVLAGSVLGPAGRPGFWAELAGALPLVP